MELSEIILATVGALSTISAWVVSNLAKDLKKLDEKLNACQIDLHDKFIQKEDYSHQMDNIDKKLHHISTLLREALVRETMKRSEKNKDD